jgi:hypothetical protein
MHNKTRKSTENVFLAFFIAVLSAENFSYGGDCQGKRETYYPWEDKVFLLTFRHRASCIL